MTMKAFQDYYPDSLSHCYGCGRLNDHGLQIKSYWDGDETICSFQPQSYHTGGIPGYVYGGLIASLIDCHANATASAAVHWRDGRKIDTRPATRFVTAALHVDYMQPTPIESRLELRGRIKEFTDRKVIVIVELSAMGKICARGEVVTVRLPTDKMPS